MRQSYAHEAVLVMAPEADLRAPGGAITVAVCGGWDHEPPCPLAPHHSQAHRRGGEVHVRTLFATEPSQENAVRDRIRQALAGGRLTRPDGVTTHWEVRSSGRVEIGEHEREQADRLLGG